MRPARAPAVFRSCLRAFTGHCAASATEGRDHRTGFNFGGGGCGYGFRCRPCSTAAFLWQQ
ncbi:hypothetical protein DRA43_14745 [Micromonospora provocatoris]|nr:hypothetical protein DRA43_14745 [Micromonospora provocatoris]